MTITEDELQRIVARAVKVALNEIKGEGEVETDKQPQTTSPVEAKPMSEDELDAAMKLMASNRGKDDEPKVGIFWYDPRTNDLFGVRSHRVSDYTKANSRTEFGSISCSEMHEDVWRKEYNRQKHHGDGKGPFIGAYENKPRGRVFYLMEEDRFVVMVGKWLEEHPEARQLILEEFDLPADKTTFQYAVHWDIGQKWM